MTVSLVCLGHGPTTVGLGRSSVGECNSGSPCAGVVGGGVAFWLCTGNFLIGLVVNFLCFAGSEGGGRWSWDQIYGFLFFESDSQ